MTDAKYAFSQKHPGIFNNLRTDMQVSSKKIKNSFFVPNPRQRYEIDIMEAEGKEKTQSMIEIL